MPAFGIYGNDNNVESKKIERMLLANLLREWKARNPWVSFDRLKDVTKAGAVFYPLALEFLLTKHFEINNIKDEYKIAADSILEYNYRLETKT